MNLNNLRCFLAVVEAGSISQAARTGFVSQQAVSDQIRRLEQDFQAPLLERTRPVRLTPAGEIVYATAQTVLAAMDDAEQQVARLRETAPRLVISTGLIRTPPFLPRLIAGFQELWPQVEVRLIHPGSAAEELDAPPPGADLIVGNMPFAPGVEGTVLFQDVLCMTLSVGLLDRLYGAGRPAAEQRLAAGITWEACRELPHSKLFQDRSRDVFDPGAFNAARAADMDMVVYRVAAGLEAAILPAHYAREIFGREEQMRVIPIVPACPAFQVGIGVWRDRPVSRAARGFIRLAAERRDAGAL